MKKLVMAVCLTVGFCKCLVWAGQDRFGSMRPAIWRSSFTESADSNVTIASTTIVLHSILVSSPTSTGSGGAVLIFDATTFTLPNLSTATIMTTDIGEPQKVYDVVFSSGLTYRKIGGAAVNFFWDFLIKNPTGRP